MAGTVYHCCDRQRRERVLAQGVLNGVDALEVIDQDLPTLHPLRQRTLLVWCLRSIAGAGLGRDNVVVTGGERVRDPRVEWAAVASSNPPQLAAPGEAAVAAIVAALPAPDQVMVVRVATTGDFSTYTLTLRRGLFDPAPPVGFDPRMAAIDFGFKVECPTDFDCPAPAPCADTAPPSPPIDYLARDFDSLRRMLLARMAQTAPDWTERSPVDGGVALVELLAWAGDQLAWRQDAIATEAYLATARLRPSLRRHARLVDYAVQDGRNARCFVHLRLRAGAPPLPLAQGGTQFLTRVDRLGVAITAGSTAHDTALQAAPVVFEPLEDATLFAGHAELRLHTWGDERCCLPRGATRATLAGAQPDLHAGQWLLFEEVKGPRTGAAADADPTHRQVVRLRRVAPAVDPLLPLPGHVTEVEWDAEDALAFPLCVSSVADAAHGGGAITDVSVARGNIVAADHGRTLTGEPLGRVPAPHLRLAAAAAGCDAPPPVPVPARFQPALAAGPLTHVAPFAAGASAARTLAADGVAQAAVVLSSRLGAGPQRPWKAVPDLFNSSRLAAEFVAETDDEGRATLRFGDGTCGRRPETGEAFSATYRTGQGRAGNIGADVLHHVVGTGLGDIEAVRNPLPAVGGTEPESPESVRRRAPEAFRRLERAVTPADYDEVTARHAGVQRAATRLRWTGSWHTVFVTVDRAGGNRLDATTRSALTSHLDRYRMANHPVALRDPRYVSLELRLHVCVAEGAFRAAVRARLREVLGAGRLADGTSGLFHPDRLSFGQPVYLSPLIAAAHAVPGVASVEARAFGRQGGDDPLPLADGVLRLGPTEIARLDNDPNYPEHGLLVLDLHGGQ